MTEIQLDLLLSFIGPSAVVRLPKYNVMIKWDKRVSALKNSAKRAKKNKNSFSWTLKSTPLQRRRARLLVCAASGMIMRVMIGRTPTWSVTTCLVSSNRGWTMRLLVETNANIFIWPKNVLRFQEQQPATKPWTPKAPATMNIMLEVISSSIADRWINWHLIRALP